MAHYSDLDDLNDPIDHLEQCRRDYESTSNPLYAWEAWGRLSACWRSPRRPDLEMPAWLQGYFDKAGRGLIGTPMLEEAGERRPYVEAKAGEGPGAIGRALGFKRGISKAREGWGGPYDEKERLADWLIEYMWENKCSMKAAATHAENEHLASVRTASEAVRTCQRWAKAKMLDRLREAGVSASELDAARAYSKLCMRRAKTGSKLGKV